MLTERKEQKLEVLPNGIIQVQNITIIERDTDGVIEEISRTYHRHVIDVDDDTSKESPRLKAISSALWTAEVKAARISEKAKNNV